MGPTSPATHTPCPQCGAPLLVPHIAEAFKCSWCGTTLRPGGVPLHYLVEQPQLSQQEAEALVRTRLVGPILTPAMAAGTTIRVGSLRYFPFLRMRMEGQDQVAPLAPVPSPELMQLAAVPAGLRPLESSPPASATTVDDATIRARLVEAAHRAVQEVAVEYRAFFPVSYASGGEHFTAVLPGAGGDLFTERRPARREVIGERAISLGCLAILFSEALFIPGLWPRMVTVAVTAGALFPILRHLVARHG